MKEELLHSYLLGDSTVGVAVPRNTFSLTLESCHLDIRLEYRLIAYNPYHLVYHTVLRCLEISIYSTGVCRIRNGNSCRISLRLGVNHMTLATLCIGSNTSTKQHGYKSYQY